MLHYWRDSDGPWVGESRRALTRAPRMLVDILQTLVSGVLVGAAYALMCVGLGLIFGVMRVVNFAQGEFVMLGMYAALFLATTLGSSGVVRSRARGRGRAAFSPARWCSSSRGCCIARWSDA